MKQALVVVPVYRTALSETERIAWIQVRRVLGAYDICLLVPKSLRLEGDQWNNVRVERFDDAFFQSRSSYSNLMLSTECYERFVDYEYMLLYQLDAFVFSDRLMEFCAKGFDYIGAPVPSKSGNWIDVGCNIGNGGFSLRKIESTLCVLQQKEKIFSKMPKCWETNKFLLWEDLFFAFCSTLPDLDFHVPDFMTALDFSVGTDIGRAYRRMPDWLPFGCHAWNISDYWFWKPLVEFYGYQLPEPKGLQNIHRRRCRIGRHIIERLPRANAQHRKKVFEILEALLPEKDRPIALWGGGTYREIIIRLLRSSGRDAAVVFDRDASEQMTAEGVELSQPDFLAIRERQLFVLVTTTTYEDEICQALSAYGFVEQKDFVRVSELLYQATYKTEEKVREI